MNKRKLTDRLYLERYRAIVAGINPENREKRISFNECWARRRELVEELLDIVMEDPHSNEGQ